MKPFFFRPLEQGQVVPKPKQTTRFDIVDSLDECPCYGVFHEPSGQYIADHAVLFVYPWGQEYVRAHRAIRRLALQLESQGVASLRFDFRCTGDSGGLGKDLTLTSARQDVKAAMNLVLDLTGADQIKVFAIRLGALIAFDSLKDDKVITHMITWDPVLDGADYLTELNGPGITTRVHDHNGLWINGYPLSEEFQRTLGQTKAPVDFQQLPVTILGAQQRPSLTDWVNNRRARGALVDLAQTQPKDVQAEWGSVDAVGGFVNPTDILATAQTLLATPEVVL